MQNILTYTKAVFSMLFWALTFVWIKVALVWYRPMEIVFLRLVLAAVLLFVVKAVIRHRERVRREDMMRFGNGHCCVHCLTIRIGKYMKGLDKLVH